MSILYSNIELIIVIILSHIKQIKLKWIH